MHHLIDVRSPAEFNQGHIEGAINLPVEQLAIQLSHGLDFKPSDNIRLYCQSGGRAGVAKTLLDRAGYLSVRNEGGINNLV